MEELGPGSAGVFEVGLCLARMLCGQVKLVPIILNLAEYWAVSSAKISVPWGAVFHAGTPLRPYLTLKITGRHKRALQQLVFTTVSRDQGWSSHSSYIGTYEASWSWFEVRNRSVQAAGHAKVLQHNMHGSSQERTHRIIWVNNVRSPISDWMETFSDGDVLEVYARAHYRGWTNNVYSVQVVAYTACF
ncbi:hypothetical protein B0H16DRAFT_1627780 [Mycena metata]|uniref:Uncharacterized protein n=1 Tax=Mycena metata TaxID=1033252 RepID=A0AAD7H4C0_9AGAR|nr:hypothetical protein B0H16DRAFT_1627780 [Mycena metata]